jgi:large subunit ribosomal protein L1
MANEGKRIRAAREGIERTKLYSLDEAVTLIKDRAKAKFDETVELAMNLGVDPAHADQMVRGVCNLPNGSGRDVRVAVFARGAKADEARGRPARTSWGRGPRRDRQRRHDRLRPLHRDPGHDAARRPSR